MTQQSTVTCPACFGSGSVTKHGFGPNDVQQVSCNRCIGSGKLLASIAHDFKSAVKADYDLTKSGVSCMEKYGLSAAAVSAILYEGKPAQPEQQHESRLLVTSWSLHTLKGKAVLKLVARGKQHYGHGTVVNQDDFAWSDLPSEHGKWRGKITDCPIEFNSHDTPGADSIRQTLTIALEKHSKITDGSYKAKGVMRSAQPASSPSVNSADWLKGPGVANTIGQNWQSMPSAQPKSQPEATPTVAPHKLRKFDLD